MPWCHFLHVKLRLNRPNFQTNNLPTTCPTVRVSRFHTTFCFLFMTVHIAPCQHHIHLSETFTSHLPNEQPHVSGSGSGSRSSTEKVNIRSGGVAAGCGTGWRLSTVRMRLLSVLPCVFRRAGRRFRRQSCWLVTRLSYSLTCMKLYERTGVCWFVFEYTPFLQWILFLCSACGNKLHKCHPCAS